MLPINHLNRDLGAGVAPAAYKAGWRPREWGAATGIGRTGVFALIASGRIDSVLFGPKVRIITTPPEVFLAALRDEAA